MHAVQLQAKPAAGSANELNILDDPRRLQATDDLPDSPTRKG
jgi:hypothetical protein